MQSLNNGLVKKTNHLQFILRTLKRRLRFLHFRLDEPNLNGPLPFRIFPNLVIGIPRAKSDFVTKNKIRGKFHREPRGFIGRVSSDHQKRVFSRVLHDSTTRFVGPSVRQSVRWSIRRSVRPSVTLYFFWVFGVFGLTAPAQMMEWPQIWPLPTRTRLR